jgi:hypothetical protein
MSTKHTASALTCHPDDIFSRNFGDVHAGRRLKYEAVDANRNLKSRQRMKESEERAENDKEEEVVDVQMKGKQRAILRGRHQFLRESVVYGF